MTDLMFRHGGNIYGIKKKTPEEIIDFSANINPLGLPLRVKRAVCENFNRILHYPDPEAKGMARVVSQRWRIKEENILVGNGSIELIYLIASCFKPKTTLIIAPTFSEYERAARTVKSKINILRLKEKEGFSFNSSGIRSSDMFFLCNPNNPTGNLLFDDGRIIDKLPVKLAVIDEAFMDFLPDQLGHTLISRTVREKKIVVLRTLTKFFALPGLRIGYLVAHKEIINKLRKYQPPWSVNSLAQMAAELILNDKEYIKNTSKLAAKEREFLFERLVKMKGLRPFPSVTNFILTKIDKPNITSKFLKDKLIKKGILIRDCSNFRNLNSKYMRIAVRSRKENLKLLDTLNLLTTA